MRARAQLQDRDPAIFMKRVLVATSLTVSAM
jgi:hypothetical protein